MLTINIYGGDNTLQIHSAGASTPIICNIYGGQNLILSEEKTVQDENSPKKES